MMELPISSALQTFLSHVNSAHLAESPAQQVQDILDVDSYVGNHLALFERMLEPLTEGGLSDAVAGIDDVDRRIRGSRVDWSRSWQESFDDALTERIKSFVEAA